MSPAFSHLVTDFWLPGDLHSVDGAGLAVIVDEGLREDLSLILLTVLDSRRIVTVTPTMATALSLADGDALGERELRARIRAAGFELNGADHLFYLPTAEQQSLLSDSDRTLTRRLTHADAAEFERFGADAPDDDLEEAFVDLDHWIVRGAFAGGRLVAAGSAYPWRAARLADIGVITLPAFRGRGYGRLVVRAIAADALSQGHEPQYRCQLDNAASTALAGSAGFARFGEWDVVVAAN